GERLEAADCGQGRAPERQRGPEAWPRQAKRESDQDARQELRVDEKRTEPCPETGDRDAVIKAGHRADARLLQRGDDARQMRRINPNVAVGHDDDVMAAAPPPVYPVPHPSLFPLP